MLNDIVQFLGEIPNRLSEKISQLVSWSNSAKGVKTLNRAYIILRICFVLLIYFYIYRFVSFVYSVAPTPNDASKFLLGLSGVVAFIWAFVRIIIIGKKLLIRFRFVKREKIDIPIRLWLKRMIINLKQTKAVIASWELLKRLARWSETITLKFILWPTHSLFEPEINVNSIEEFLSASKISESMKLRYGEQVFRRYVNWGFPISVLLSFISFFILLPVMSWIIKPLLNLVTFMADYWGQLITDILFFIIVLFEMILILSFWGSFFIGALMTFGKRMNLWRNKSLSSLTPQEPQQQEYQELKEHVARKMNELMNVTERVNEANEQERQQKQAFAKIRSLDSEQAGSVGVFVDMRLAEERAKTEVVERRKEQRGRWFDVGIGFFFLMLGLFIQSDFAQSWYSKLLVLILGR